MRSLWSFALAVTLLGGQSTADLAALEKKVQDLEQELAALKNSSDTSIYSIDQSIVALQDKDSGFVTALDTMWLLVCGSLVMFMQAGFAILESGACREKNAGLVLMKNVLDACLGCLVWYLVGYGLAYGAPDDPNVFIGVKNFAGTDFEPPHHLNWFFQWAFCATAATIVSGAVAERIEFSGYVIFASVMTGLIYPVVVWWTWSGNGWLTNMGYVDFAGSGIVHLCGGAAALAGAAIVGPRKGRWTSEPGDFDPHNMAMVVTGTFILWFGWYGFNCGSTLFMSDAASANVGAKVAMNTSIAGSLGGLTVFISRVVRAKMAKSSKLYDLAAACNGILVGLVASCAGVDVVDAHGALLLGILGGLAYELGSAFVQKIGVDDPLDAFAVHGCGGMTGVIMGPLLDASGVDGRQFGAHIVALLVIGAWSGGLSAITFLILRFAGLLRISEAEEIGGCDMHMAQQYHSPPKAYDLPVEPVSDVAKPTTPAEPVGQV